MATKGPESLSVPARNKRPAAHPGARATALTILLNIHRQQPLADDVVDSIFESLKVREVDRGLIFELVYGVLRHRETLDWRLNQFADRPMSRLPLTVAMIFRLGAYQLLYLDKIPPSAAVNESVKLAKTIGGRNWSGMMNAVLRNIIRQPAPPWPDPSEDPILALSIRHSCPSWVVERWLSAWGTQKTQTLCEATLQIPPLTLRTNTLQCSRDELIARLRSEGHAARETTISPLGVMLEKCGKLGDLGPLTDGWCYIEDEAAQLIPPLLDTKPDHHVLDACAAPGGKTTHISQLMLNHGQVIAVDRDAQRLKRLTSNSQRLGLTNIMPVCADMETDIPSTPSSTANRTQQNTWTSLQGQKFDRILLDVPCSGLGVLRRHPEGKWLKGPDLIDHVQRLQGKILEQVSTLLRPGGVLVYSACSTEVEETSQVVDTFLEHHQDCYQDSVKPWLPPAAQALVNDAGSLVTSFNTVSMDGFFAARVRKQKR
ncbi:MAG: ribosomal RNA small subunit methyltransferase B [Nitrospirales bacterium]|nr:MAG: ribosomal RNA small subunit methyltransferase B [Nitrospirales bacterium]